MGFETGGMDKREFALKLLKDKYDELQRIPKKSDFSPETVCFIKQKLGAWSRAVEAAGLKKPPDISAKEKSKLKRIRRKKLIKIQKKLSNKNVSDSIGNTNSEEKTEDLL